jgi:hypothetical protein
MKDAYRRQECELASGCTSIYSRNLGDGAIYELPQGLNGSWQTSGLMLPPHGE